MAQATKQGAAVARRAEKKLDWPADLLHLPRRFGMKWADLGLVKDDIRRTVELARNGRPAEEAKAHRVVQVLIELMGRDQEERFCYDSRKRQIYIDANGRETAQRFSMTDHNDDGGALEHIPKTEVRSRWGIRAGHETLQAPGLPAPQPGHWKRMVLDNWDNLLPQLVFLSDSLETGHLHYRDNVEAYRAAHTAATSNESLKRRELAEWLTEFLKRPESAWNGEE